MSILGITKARPVMIAIGGDSGSGKTTLSRGIYDIFGEENILNVCLDDYHTLDRDGRTREGVTALNPIANNIRLMEEHVWHLRNGESIVKPVYDHSTGTFGEPEVVRPRPIIIMRGLFPLLTERMRSAFDVKLWLDPQEELKYHWKLQRDVAQRGYAVEQVIAQIVHRQDDLRQFIMPQLQHADTVAHFFAPPQYLERRRAAGADEHLPVRIMQRPAVPPVDFGGLLEGRSSVRTYDAIYRGNSYAVFEVNGDIAREQVAAIEDRLWAHMESHKDLRPPQIGRFLEDGRNERLSPTLALAQLLVGCRVAGVRDALTRGREVARVG
ncbi:MAG: phosphoribulokinase [Vulcanimicrobiaceae bacterium]